MSTQSTLACVALALLCSAGAFARQPAQDVQLPPNAPKDKPGSVTADESRLFEYAIKPHVEQARKTYPEAKQRFLKGLPQGHVLFVTTRLYDARRRFEQVFVAVSEIREGKIRGMIASDVRLVPSYRQGDYYTFPESELYDWTISRPDGTEEGNFVGKFLDTYRVQTLREEKPLSRAPVTPENMRRRIEEAAAKYQEHAPVPRILLYDIGYPRDAEEYARLDGHAVLLVTALSQERGELPLRRLYVSAGGREVELKPLKLALSEQTAALDLAARTFGPFREDALYLLPLHLRARAGELLADFASNRTRMKLADFGTPLPDDVSGFGVKPPTGSGPSADALQEFIRREYPSFFRE
jgi:hypothetical protein